MAASLLTSRRVVIDEFNGGDLMQTSHVVRKGRGAASNPLRQPPQLPSPSLDDARLATNHGPLRLRIEAAGRISDHGPRRARVVLHR